MNRIQFISKILRWSVALVLATFIAGCGGVADSSATLANLASIAVTPATATVAIGGTQQFVATATYNDGTPTGVVTTSTSWTSASTGVATVNSTSGLATGVAAGTSVITGSYGGKSATATLTVSAGGGGAGTLTLSANAPIVTEPATGTKAMTFVLTLASAPATAVTLNYATQITGTATSGADFVAATGTVNFAAGKTVATKSILVNNDADAEPDETVKVLFSGADLVASVTGTGTILANDTTGNTVVLTAGLDNFTPTVSSFGAFSTANDDTVNTNGPTQLTSADTIATGAGFDTLSITPTSNVAYTLDDAIFTNVSGIDKIVILTSGTGAQTITTGTLFNAAFDAAGADLQTTSTSGAQTINMSAVTGPATLTSISDASVAGNFITMGAGVTTVTATSTSGAMTINSAAAVVATVTATTTSGAVTVTTGAGADSVTLTTGDTSGNVITTGAGNDTIDASATTASTSGNTITGGLGADAIILTGNTSKDTIVIADGDTGITVATADSITGFTAADDTLKMGLAGSAPNYVEAGAAVADFAAALTAANVALDTTVLYAFEFDATNGYLFKDTNADGTADEVVVLVGITNASIAFANIVP